MLGMFALLFMALWQDYRDGGKSPPPVVAGVGVTTFAYLIGVLFMLDKEVSEGILCYAVMASVMLCCHGIIQVAIMPFRVLTKMVFRMSLLLPHVPAYNNTSGRP